MDGMESRLQAEGAFPVANCLSIYLSIRTPSMKTYVLLATAWNVVITHISSDQHLSLEFLYVPLQTRTCTTYS